MRITLISDTHGLHWQVTLPGGDLLIHAGDLTPMGQIVDVEQFLSWYRQQNYRYKVFIAGNHDWLFQRNPELVKKIMVKFPAITYLQDSGVEIEGLKLYGSPWQPEFRHWAFNLPRRGVELARAWAKIPSDTHILITHTPPYGVLDKDSRGHDDGCEVLARRVAELNLKLHVFGHFHGSHGQEGISVNASVCNESYEPINQPITLDV